MKKIIRYVSLALLGWVAITGIFAINREKRVENIRVGITEKEVVALLGPGRPDVMSPACNDCPKERKQLAFKANQSLWYGRFEDSIIICFVDGVVCDFTRVGL